MKVVAPLSSRLCLGLAALMFAAAAGAHPALASATPKNGAVLHAPPKAFRLSFNEPVEAAFTTVTLVPEGLPATGKLPMHAVDGDAKAVLADAPALAPGRYTLQWSAMGQDGHRAKGAIAFVLKDR